MKRTTVLLLTAPVLLAAGCSGPGRAGTGTGTAAAITPVVSASATPPSATVPASETALDPIGGTSASTRCHTPGLALKPGQEEGAAGTEYLALVITNTSSRTCTLYGYPGVSWVTGARGTQVGDPFRRGGIDKKITISLKAGQAAHAILQMPNPGNYDPAVCKPVSVRGLRVYPPDETAAIFVSLPSKQCSAKGVNIDTVWAVAAGIRADPAA